MKKVIKITLLITMAVVIKRVAEYHDTSSKKCFNELILTEDGPLINSVKLESLICK